MNSKICGISTFMHFFLHDAFTSNLFLCPLPLYNSLGFCICLTSDIKASEISLISAEHPFSMGKRQSN